MSKFHFGPQRGMFGEEFTPEPVDMPDTPDSQKASSQDVGDGLGESSRSIAFRFSQSLLGKKAEPAAAVDSTFKFAPRRPERRGYWDSEPSGSTTTAFEFAAGLLKKDCHCEGSCSDCAAKTAKNHFSPGQKLRHKKTGKVYEMVKTYCLSKDDCYCVLKRDGVEHDCLFYTGEVEAVA
jgi:hypothetical protein